MLKAAPHGMRHLAPGDKLGKYELIRQIAVGGMAELYLARTHGIEGFEKLVVLKRILPQHVRQAAFVDMFLHEARLAATLHHANIAQVYDIGGNDGDYFFAMEYVHGEDLDRVSMVADEQGVPLSMDAALTLVSGLCAGLHYAHERTGADGKPMGIVHRDVSPSNVLVSYDGAVKLVDFGIAWAASRPGTSEGGLEGKIAYMSPEQCRGKAPIDRRSDLYSVGTLLYELTTGRPPFAGETEYQVLHQIVNADVPPPSAIVPGYPAQLERIVLRALARDPDQRYATALALQSDVEDFAHESRMRISPLVLARLMSMLFPLRLEEWDQARSQGGHFLEQHVLRTLDASGKTAEGTEPGHHAEDTTEDHTANERTTPERLPGNTASSGNAMAEGTMPEITASGLGAAPITFTRPDAGFPSTTLPSYERTDSAGEPLPPPPSIDVPAPPEPPKPTPYPVVTELMSATPGALVTAAGKYGGVPTTAAGQRADPTERVRLRPRRASTELVRTRARRSLIWIGLVVVAVAVAAFLVLRPSSSERVAPAAESPAVGDPAPAVEDTTPAVEDTTPAVEDTTPAAVAPSPAVDPSRAVAPSPAVDPSRAVAPSPAAADTPPDANVATPSIAAEAKQPSPKKMVAKPKSKPARRPAPKPEPKKAAKENPWNADSPFMPVRTKK